jgi:hypothetical protein
MAEHPARPTLSAPRALGIAARTAHLGAMALLAGGAWFGVPGEALRGVLAGTVLSGLALLVSEATHSRHWVYQVRGLAALAHVGAALLLGALGPGALLAAIVIGAVGTHLPKGLRAWSLRHGAAVD